jgi:hypothetical protein
MYILCGHADSEMFIGGFTQLIEANAMRIEYNIPLRLSTKFFSVPHLFIRPCTVSEIDTALLHRLRAKTEDYITNIMVE